MADDLVVWEVREWPANICELTPEHNALVRAFLAMTAERDVLKMEQSLDKSEKPLMPEDVRRAVLGQVGNPEYTRTMQPLNPGAPLSEACDFEALCHELENTIRGMEQDIFHLKAHREAAVISMGALRQGLRRLHEAAKAILDPDRGEEDDLRVLREVVASLHNFQCPGKVLGPCTCLFAGALLLPGD